MNPVVPSIRCVDVIISGVPRKNANLRFFPQLYSEFRKQITGNFDDVLVNWRFFRGDVIFVGGRFGGVGVVFEIEVNILRANKSWIIHDSWYVVIVFDYWFWIFVVKK